MGVRKKKNCRRGGKKTQTSTKALSFREKKGDDAGSLQIDLATQSANGRTIDNY